MVTFTIQIDDAGDATITIQEGRAWRQNAEAVADLTQQIADALGTTIERHVGHHHVQTAHHDQKEVTT